MWGQPPSAVQRPRLIGPPAVASNRVGQTLLSDAFDPDLDFAPPLHQLQNLLMQRRLQFQFESRLPIQLEVIQHAPFNPVLTFDGAPVWHSSFPRVRLPARASRAFRRSQFPSALCCSTDSGSPVLSSAAKRAFNR